MIGKKIVILQVSDITSLTRTGKLKGALDATLDGTLSRVSFFSILNRKTEDVVLDLPEKGIYMKDFGLSKGVGASIPGIPKIQKLANFLGAIWEIYRETRNQEVSLIMSQDTTILGLVALVVSFLSGVPYAIMVVYDNDLHFQSTGKPHFSPFYFRKVEMAVEWMVFKCARGVISENKHYLQYALQHGASPHKSYQGVYHVDDIHYEPLSTRNNLKEEYGIKGKKSIMWTGRLVRAKFPEDVIQTMNPVTRVVPGAILLIVGEGDERQSLERMVEDAGLTKNVKFIGLLPQTKMRDLMSSVDAIVLTQGMGVALEASLSGTPIVAYDYEFNKEIIQTDRTGIIVPVRDIQRLSEGIIRIFMDPEYGRSLGKNAREQSMREYSIPLSRKALKDFYDAILQ